MDSLDAIGEIPSIDSVTLLYAVRVVAQANGGIENSPAVAKSVKLTIPPESKSALAQLKFHTDAMSVAADAIHDAKSAFDSASDLPKKLVAGNQLLIAFNLMIKSIDQIAPLLNTILDPPRSDFDTIESADEIVAQSRYSEASDFFDRQVIAVDLRDIAKCCG